VSVEQPALQAVAGGDGVPLYVGGFVWTYDRALLGKLVELAPDRARVRIVHSIADREERLYAPTHLARAFLSPQSRVYVPDEAQESWSAGRVVDYDLAGGDGNLAYVVRRPGRDDTPIPERDLEARCFAPTVDPTDVLASGGAESQFFHDRRLRALRAMLAQRGASAGVGGLVSGSVDLRLHQLHVVRRVIEDPVQRYLLADEVGLGKTIEAGAVIRQLLTDLPSARVAVVAPTSLLWQWERELREKFDIEHDGDQLTLCSTPSIDELIEGGGRFDLLVIDEAHHLIRRGGAVDRGYRQLADLAHRVDRLLLLTATPVLSDEAATLALLHLLDPATYRIEDTEGFRSRLERRQEYGELVLALDPDVPLALLGSTVRQIAELLPRDDEVARHTAAVLDPVLRDDERRAAVHDLRHHLSDTYRLDHRLMRTRRADAGWTGRSCPIITVEVDDDSRVEDLVTLLEQWRADAAAAATPDTEAELALLHQELVEALGAGLDAFAGALRRRSTSLQVGSPEAFAGEPSWLRDSLSACEREGEGMSRLDLCAAAIELALPRLATPHGDAPPRLVAFTSSTTFARQLEVRLQTLHTTTVAAVTSDLDHLAVEAAVTRFLESDWPAVLVADRAAEEGLNLQASDGLLHVDLPLAPERLEQRIGRLDRLGRRRLDIPTRVVLPSDADGSPWFAWHELLRDGFGLYSRSISDVQFLLDDLQERARLALFRRGAAGLAELTGEVRDALEDERRRLDQQYALEQLDLEARDELQTFEHVEQAERRSQIFEDDLGGWLFGVLGFGRERRPNDSFRVHWRDDTRVPERPGWRERFDPALERPLTFRRDRATADPEVRLVRPGFPLVDETLRLMRRDDRGTAFATWRTDPRWPAASGEWLGFRLTYVVEIDEEQLRELIETDHSIPFAPVRRVANDLLSPWIETRDYDAQLARVTDPLLLDILARDYDNRADLNLGSRPRLLDSVVDRQHFVSLCRNVRARSEALLREEPQFAARLERVQAAALQLLATQQAQLDRRQEALQSLGETDVSLQQRRRVTEALRVVVASARVRLEAIGAFVVSHDLARVAT